MPQRDRPEGWWKICNHPIVQGLHRVFTLIGAPIIVAALLWVASTFDQLRQDVTRLNVLLTSSIENLQESHRDDQRRIENLEQILNYGQYLRRRGK